ARLLRGRGRPRAGDHRSADDHSGSRHAARAVLNLAAPDGTPERRGIAGASERGICPNVAGGSGGDDGSGNARGPPRQVPWKTDLPGVRAHRLLPSPESVSGAAMAAVWPRGSRAWRVVRQRVEPAPGPRRGAPPRNRRAPRYWRDPRAAPPPDVDGSPHLELSRGYCRTAVRVVG